MLEMELKQQYLIDCDEDEVLERLVDNTKENNNGCTTDAIIDLNDILDCLHNDPNSFIKNLEKKKDDLASDYNCCEICGEEKIFIVDDSLPQYQSQPVGITRCPNNCEA